MNTTDGISVLAPAYDTGRVDPGAQALCSVAVADKEHPAHPVCFLPRQSSGRIPAVAGSAATGRKHNALIQSVFDSLSKRLADDSTHTILPGLLHSVTAPQLQSWASMAGMLLPSSSSTSLATFCSSVTPPNDPPDHHVVSKRRLFCPIGPPRLQRLGHVPDDSRDVVARGVDAGRPPAAVAGQEPAPHGGGCVCHSAVKQWTENACCTNYRLAATS